MKHSLDIVTVVLAISLANVVVRGGEAEEASGDNKEQFEHLCDKEHSLRKELDLSDDYDAFDEEREYISLVSKRIALGQRLGLRFCPAPKNEIETKCYERKQKILNECMTDSECLDAELKLSYFTTLCELEDEYKDRATDATGQRQSLYLKLFSEVIEVRKTFSRLIGIERCPVQAPDDSIPKLPDYKSYKCAEVERAQAMCARFTEALEEEAAYKGLESVLEMKNKWCEMELVLVHEKKRLTELGLCEQDKRVQGEAESIAEDYLFLARAQAVRDQFARGEGVLKGEDDEEKDEEDSLDDSWELQVAAREVEEKKKKKYEMDNWSESDIMHARLLYYDELCVQEQVDKRREDGMGLGPRAQMYRDLYARVSKIRKAMGRIVGKSECKQLEWDDDADEQEVRRVALFGSEDLCTQIKRAEIMCSKFSEAVDEDGYRKHKEIVDLKESYCMMENMLKNRRFKLLIKTECPQPSRVFEDELYDIADDWLFIARAQEMVDQARGKKSKEPSFQPTSERSEMIADQRKEASIELKEAMTNYDEAQIQIKDEEPARTSDEKKEKKKKKKFGLNWLFSSKKKKKKKTGEH